MLSRRKCRAKSKTFSNKWRRAWRLQIHMIFPLIQAGQVSTKQCMLWTSGHFQWIKYKLVSRYLYFCTERHKLQCSFMKRSLLLCIFPHWKEKRFIKFLNLDSTVPQTRILDCMQIVSNPVFPNVPRKFETYANVLKLLESQCFESWLSFPGIALLYLQLYRVTQEASHLQRALDYVKRTLRNLNGRRVTFLCGDAGPLAVGAVVHHHLKNQADSQECLTK